MMLRHWQSECIRKAMRQYQKGQRHFFCQATPGAGKTKMSAELARNMLDTGLIDLVVCFAPSREVVSGFRSTLEGTIGKTFDGRLGSLGVALTYQAMGYLDDNFWSLFSNYRVLAVFDVIHHCSDHGAGISNHWGQLIVQRIQDSAAFTLALSGTPWRSDELGIALARYSTPEGKLICDYRYSLRQAVADGVCRSPRIVLLDNEDVNLTVTIGQDRKVKQFKSIATLLSDSSVRYQDLLDNTRAITCMLEHANARLNELRRSVKDAAGLVVASTIEHAWQIAVALETLGERACVVSSESPDARSLIQAFRSGPERWIVAVGMIAEGTDIPRIQVCCHLTRVRTELHFRQVLGRTLRRRSENDNYAWMYIYAEPALHGFALRVAEDIPGDQVVLSAANKFQGTEIATNPDPEVVTQTGQASTHLSDCFDVDKPEVLSVRPHRLLQFSEHFRHQLLTIF